MKLVIDIPEELYTNIVEDNYSMADIRILLTVIKNGTPLPKGHDDLIDRKQVYRDVLESLGIISAILNVPTIIEADTESEG